jgi:hypothetical protein
MTATTTTVLRCDRDGCRESLAAEPRENDLELRIRAARDHGWRFTPSLRQGGQTDLCRWHA